MPSLAPAWRTRGASPCRFPPPPQGWAALACTLRLLRAVRCATATVSPKPGPPSSWRGRARPWAAPVQAPQRRAPTTPCLATATPPRALPRASWPPPALTSIPTRGCFTLLTAARTPSTEWSPPRPRPQLPLPSPSRVSSPRQKTRRRPAIPRAIPPPSAPAPRIPAPALGPSRRPRHPPSPPPPLPLAL